MGYYAFPYERALGDNEYIGPDYALGAAGRYFNMRKASIYGGSNEIQRNIIAKAVSRPLEGHDMDFSFSEEQTLLRNSVARYLADNYTFDAWRKFTRASERARSAAIGSSSPSLACSPRLCRRLMAGWAAARSDAMVVMEEFGKALVVEPYVPTVVIAGGDDRARAAPKRRRKNGCRKSRQANPSSRSPLPNPQGRYNLADLRTTAKKQGAGYVLNGHKAVVLGAPWADTLIVTARTRGRPAR